MGKHSTSLKNHAVRTVIVASSVWRERLEKRVQAFSKGPDERKPPVVAARLLSSPKLNPPPDFSVSRIFRHNSPTLEG